MEFEFDPKKSADNKIKHGIDFEEAQELWSKKVVFTPLAHTEERRWAVFGLIDEVHYTAIITYRHKSIRIISVRRSRSKEIDHYEQSQENSR
jgi:uncharacterized DUF497 family protein